MRLRSVCRCLKVLTRRELGNSRGKIPGIERAYSILEALAYACPVVPSFEELAYAGMPTDESRRYKGQNTPSHEH